MLGRMLLRRGVPAVVRPVTRTIVLPIRSYATPGRPKSVVGEPSRPVKRAVKKAAAKPADGSSPAAKNDAAKRDAAAKKSKKTSPTKRQPKQLTEAQTAALKERQAKAKARKQVVVEKEKLNELKRIALSPPKLVGDNPYAVFTKEKNKERGSLSTASESSTRETRLKNFTERVTAVAAEWKSLNAAEREHFNHVSRTAAEASRAEYKRWVESHSAEEIRLANNARQQLDKKYRTDKGKQSAWPLIKDERAVTRPVSAYLHFSNNRQASGDFRNIPVTERVALIAKEWKELSESEKKKYQHLYVQDLARYQAEYEVTYQHAPPAARLPLASAA
ncbi:unnamed protein product [Zymoseptoria tritici ST99CH_3D1]|nr:unnamed protein product [Zymoseptoria tritici ST99CH_3D1]